MEGMEPNLVLESCCYLMNCRGIHRIQGSPGSLLAYRSQKDLPGPIYYCSDALTIGVLFLL